MDEKENEAPHSHGHPAFWGTISGLIAALGYTTTNIFLRSVSHCDVVWVSCVKSIPLVLIFGPWLMWRRWRGLHILPPPKVLLMLLVASIICHIAGNVAFQWALGVVGLALSVSLTLGTMIAAGAVLGRVFLRESVTPQMIMAMVILIASVFVLKFGAEQAQQSIEVADATAAWLVTAGVAAACLAGFAYALLGVVVRHASDEGTPQTATLFVVGLSGLLVLSSLTVWRSGLTHICYTAPGDLTLMILAGLCNAGAFLALTIAFRLTSVVYVNALNASQAAMAAAAGVLLFDEPITNPLLAGVALSMVGLALMRRRKADPPTPELEEAGEAAAEAALGIPVHDD